MKNENPSTKVRKHESNSESQKKTSSITADDDDDVDEKAEVSSKDHLSISHGEAKREIAKKKI